MLWVGGVTFHRVCVCVCVCVCVLHCSPFVVKLLFMALVFYWSDVVVGRFPAQSDHWWSLNYSILTARGIITKNTMIQEELHNHNNKTSFACSEASWLWKPQTLWMRLSACYWWSTAQIQCWLMCGRSTRNCWSPRFNQLFQGIKRTKAGVPRPQWSSTSDQCICMHLLWIFSILNEETNEVLSLIPCRTFTRNHIKYNIQRRYTPQICVSVCAAIAN